MKPWMMVVLVVLLGGLVMAALAQAPGGMGCGQYNKATETTVTGTIQTVQQFPGKRGNTGIHLLLKSKDSTLDVHVGPSWYLDKQGFKFAEGETVEVTGSMLKTNDAIVARIIKKGDKTLSLRNAAGCPLWAGPNKA